MPYFADHSSNKVQTDLFPISSLRKLVRIAIPLDDPSLYSTIPCNGTETLRHAIADYLRRYRGMVVDPDQVIVGCGTKYLYGRLMQLFGAERKTVLEEIARTGLEEHVDVTAPPAGTHLILELGDTGIVPAPKLLGTRSNRSRSHEHASSKRPGGLLGARVRGLADSFFSRTGF